MVIKNVVLFEVDKVDTYYVLHRQMDVDTISS